MDKNTKLIVRQGVGYDHIDTENGETVAYDLEAEHARRIVACVNACAGMPTEYLEKVGLPEFAGKTLCADMAQQELDRVTAQRDQLLAALEAIMALHDSAKRENEVAVAIEQARQAIAAVKGE